MIFMELDVLVHGYPLEIGPTESISVFPKTALKWHKYFRIVNDMRTYM